MLSARIGHSRWTPANDFLRRQFQEWYSDKICRQFQGVDPKEPVDLRLTIMKPLGAKWMISLCKHFRSNTTITQNGFNFITKHFNLLHFWFDLLSNITIIIICIHSYIASITVHIVTHISTIPQEIVKTIPW